MKPFWIIWFCWIFVGAAGISMVSLGKSYSLSLGLSAVAVLTAFNLANGFGRIVAAILSEIIGGERTGALIFGLSALGYAVLPHTNSEAVIMIMATFIGMSFGTLFTVTSPLASGIFGLKNFGMIYGLIFTAYGFIGGVLGPTVGGMVLDKTDGNYMIVFTYLAAFSLIGAVLMIVLKRNCDKIK
jgi:OFA family oxalate/formate antiporter-like MFS transporter